ncbi:C69 family dipeptidase [Limosilactobacillus frumenti]|uniref:C69 family dipeptidase n=1 Tax=Limosilactobacillus frumenti TaxID=104955 RepID=UPI0007090C5A|nr:C69 family dipeptidase [Limosilactobacillus frumenti]MBA2914036.1 C69 family dipeptidase [Limosilactobacillus frumenti]QFG72379.1 C69 family dipeptidase [Limosilactobacillus frumenti]
MSKHTCTTFLAGKKATLDGSTIVCREEDYGNAFNPQRFVVVKADQQPRHYSSKTTKFEIDLPDNPLAYTSTPDADPSAGVFAAGGINQDNVSMTGTETITTNARMLSWDPYNEESGLGEEDLVTITLPYIHSAREGVQRVGNLLQKYGTYESNALAFGDQDEVWYLETLGGHHWAAVRIPDDAYVIAPNRLNIDCFDFSSDDTLCSPDLKDFIDHHSMNPEKGKYNLRKIFGSYTDTDCHYNNPRAWYVQTRLSDSHQEPIDQDLPFINHADHLISISEINSLMSSHFQDTPFDPYTNKEAPFRSIALNRNLELHILQIRNNVPSDRAAIHWLAFGPNTFNVPVPFFANVTDTPAAYRDTESDFNVNQMYWLNHTITALGDRMYHQAMPLVEQMTQKVMAKTLAIQHQFDHDPSNGRDLQGKLTECNQQMATIAQTEAETLLGKLVGLTFKQERLQY